MNYKKGAFTAGQMQMVINAGKRAEDLLKSGSYANAQEKEVLESEARVGRKYQVMLEKHKKENGL